MKYYRFIFILFIVTGCTQNKSEIIIGKWKIDDIVADVNFSKIPEAQRATYRQNMADHFARQKAMGYYEFLENGKAISFDGKVEFPLRWRLSEDEKQLCMKPENEVKDDCLRIEEITSVRLVLLFKDKDGEIRTTLVKN